MQEGSRMFASSTGAEVVNDRCQVGELAGGVSPNISTMSFLCAWHQHLYWRFVGVDHSVFEYRFA